MRTRWKVVLGFFSAAVVVALYSVWSFTEQINTTIQARECSRQVEGIRERDGAYPKEFSCKDHRGRVIFYRLDGDGYVLSNEPGARRRWVADICFMWWKPVVITESGELARCSI